MGFPEKLAQSCVTSDLGAKDEQIRSVEHVAALSGASSIGSDLMRAKDYDVQALRRAILILARHARQSMRLSMEPSKWLATAAILEVMHWQCRSCNGASEQRLDGIRMICPACGGVGVHRWTDSERARVAGIPRDAWSTWAKKYERVLAYAREHDSWTVPNSAAKLGY